MLGAFVHDPLINWRLMGDGHTAGAADGNTPVAAGVASVGGNAAEQGAATPFVGRAANNAGGGGVGVGGGAGGGGGGGGGALAAGGGENPLQRFEAAVNVADTAAPVGSVVNNGPGTGSVMMRGGSLLGVGAGDGNNNNNNNNNNNVDEVKSKAAASMHRVTDKLNGAFVVCT